MCFFSNFENILRLSSSSQYYLMFSLHFLDFIKDKTSLILASTFLFFEVFPDTDQAALVFVCSVGSIKGLLSLLVVVDLVTTDCPLSFISISQVEFLFLGKLIDWLNSKDYNSEILLNQPLPFLAESILLNLLLCSTVPSSVDSIALNAESLLFFILELLLMVPSLELRDPIF